MIPELFSGRPVPISLGGIQKNSFIDYPGKVSCVLFLSGCNFHCPYCHNPDLARGVAPDVEILPGTQLDRFLAQRKGFLDGVVISGGEPTLQKHLPALCRRIQDLGFPVKLDTNGSRPNVLEHLIRSGAVDYIAMDIKTDPGNYADFLPGGDRLPEIQNSIDLIMASGIDYEFRTTCVRPFVDERIVARICRCISGAKLYVLQTFQEGNVLTPAFFQTRDRGIDAAEMARYSEIAASRGVRCICR